MRRYSDCAGRTKALQSGGVVARQGAEQLFRMHYERQSYSRPVRRSPPCCRCRRRRCTTGGAPTAGWTPMPPTSSRSCASRTPDSSGCWLRPSRRRTPCGRAVDMLEDTLSMSERLGCRAVGPAIQTDRYSHQNQSSSAHEQSSSSMKYHGDGCAPRGSLVVPPIGAETSIPLRPFQSQRRSGTARWCAAARVAVSRSATPTARCWPARATVPLQAHYVTEMTWLEGHPQ